MLNLATLKGKNPSWTLRGSTLSEYGSEQLETITLSALTGNATYANRTEAIFALLHRQFPTQASQHRYFDSHAKLLNLISCGA